MDLTNSLGQDLNSKYQRLAILNSRNCTRGDNFPPGEDLSMNFYSISYFHSSMSSDTVLDFALNQWELEPYVYGIGDDVKYSNVKLQDFANIVHYKTTEYGCHYQLCNMPKMPTMNVLACIFNNP
ncbi:SCP-like protein [Ostertagia ostertagi]